MKRKKRRDKYISPNNLTVPEWSKPIEKQYKIISGVAFAILIICYAIMKSDIYCPPIVEIIIVLAIPISLILSIVFPTQVIGNKLLKEMHKNDFDDVDDNEEQGYYELDDDDEYDEDDDDDDEPDEAEDEKIFDYEYEQYFKNNSIR